MPKIEQVKEEIIGDPFSDKFESSLGLSAGTAE
jgi:hypothetical protein